MGGWTKVTLKDTSEESVVCHNARLDIFGVPKKYRFQSNHHAVTEYEWYLAKRDDPKIDATYPEHMFPPNKICSFEDFLKFWGPSKCGECFVPPPGSLTFDCCFGRTSRAAMRAIGRYLIANMEEIDRRRILGSFHTFMERGMTASERNIWDGSRAA